MPAILVDGKFSLFESHTIMRYLANKYKKFQLYPENLEKRAKIDAYLDWHLGNLRKYSSGLLKDKLLAPKMKFPL